MSLTTSTGRPLFPSILLGAALVALLSVLALLPALGFLAYPLVPGIDIAGLIFSSGIESLHLLRFEVASIFFNIVIYSALFYLLFSAPRTRTRGDLPPARYGAAEIE